ncbi:metallophosphatase family protein (plasmid) [Jeotgalibaca sp. MA1X17-3]|uniref:metallophosphoesterase family protein n=1 Tax=Jeotgalibaca sp. MA1X17-3 TaxID=2908211 RepID=UPI001F30A8FE|nr:metallophosphoesterase family protein [Jeotgalibaca sp. MA1X17-3]UJF16769.1 metallophosphatase family protein [Jeotgalibaca sp. MA1X17-3]
MKIGIVQISDIHNRNNDNFQKVEELKKVLNAHYLVHCYSIFLVINGDMAFSGTKQEYSESEFQVLEIKEVIEKKLNKNCDVYCVPGNHDCNFNRNSKGRELLVEKIQNGSDEISDEIVEEVILQEEYNDFEDIFNNDWQHSSLNKKNYLAKNISHLDNDGNIVVNLNLVNTAWISEKMENPGKMIFPCDYTKDIFTYDNSCLNITVMHHPSNWLNPDNKREFDKIILKNSDILLTGHEHGDEENNLNGIHIFEGGVLNESMNPDISSFRIMIYDTDSKTVSVTDFRWNKFEKIYSEGGENKEYAILAKEDNSKKNMSNTLTFSEEHTSYINSLEDPFHHPSKGTIFLKDIFVWPNFKNKKLGSDKFLSISGETFKKRLLDSTPSYWLINSPRKYGKTTLAKSVTQYLLQNGFIPFLSNGKGIKKRHIHSITKFLEDEINSQYTGLSWDRFIQEELELKYLILDNWDSIEVNESGKEKLLEQLQHFFDIL